MIDCNKCITENCMFNTLVPKENCELYREEDTTTDCTDCKSRIRAEAIDEFVEILKEPITLDRLTSSRDRIKTLAIIKYKAGILKGDFKEGE